MELETRRWTGRLIRLGLVVLAVTIAVVWIARRVLPNRPDVTLETEAPAPEALQPGDLRIYNADTSVQLVLAGDRILAGLSPKSVEKVRAEMEKSAAQDTAGLGGSIAQLVKQTVASKIGTHVSYPLADIRDMRYEKGQIIIERTRGRDIELFGNDGDNESKSFREDDAQRFIAAVRIRKKALAASQ